MAASPAALRRLYEPGFEGWDIGFPCIISDYMIFGVALACAGMCVFTMKRSGSAPNALLVAFIVFSLLDGITYLFGGVTHNLLRSYFDNGYTMEGKSEWKRFWAIAMTVSAVSSAANLNLALAFSDITDGCWNGVSWLVGGLIALVELSTIVGGNLDRSGIFTTFWAMFAALIASAVVFKNGLGVGGLWPFLSAFVCRIVSGVVMITTPAACRAKATMADCPYPAMFNSNVIAHVLVMASIALLFVGTMQRTSSSKPYEKMSERDAIA